MATCTMYKIVFNGVVLPDIYFSYDAANAAYKSMKESSCAGNGRVVLFDDETGQIS